MAKNKINLPMSQGGLRSFQEYGYSFLQFTPDKLIFGAVVFIIIMVLLLKMNFLSL